MTTNQLRAHLAMLGANVLWGGMAPMVKIVMASGLVTSLMLTNFRMAGAAVLFWCTSLFTPREHVPAADLLRLAGAAMLGIVFNQGCYVFGVGLTSPCEASVITTTMHMWVMLLAAVLLHEPITLKKAGGIVLGAAGALILVFSSASAVTSSASNPALGDVLVLTAQLSYALYLTFYRNFIRKYSVVTLMKWMFLFASLAVVPLSLPQWLATDWKSFTLAEAGGAAYIVVGATFLSYICVMIGQKNLRPTLVGMYNYVQPVVACAIGIMLGLDTFTAIKILAVALIFSGVYLVNISKAAKTDKN